MRKNILPLALTLVMSWICCSCEQDFDRHYDAENTTTIDKSIVEILAANPNFSLFSQAIKRLDLEITLGESAIYTCLAPRNKDVQTWLDKNSWGSIEQVPDLELRKWLNYHLIMGMYYRYDISKRLKTYKPTDRGYYDVNVFKTRQEQNVQGKFVRIYTEDFLSSRGDDYRFLANRDETNFSVDYTRFSDSCDIDAANGVIHILDGPLDPLPRADEAIAMDTSLSILNQWLDRYVAWNIVGVGSDGKIDTTKVKSYTFGANIANESEKFTFIAPTNKAIREFFGKYLEDNFYGEFDSIPSSLVTPILKAVVAGSYWAMSDITKGNQSPYFISIGAVYTRMANDIEPYYAGGIMSSNAQIYKVDKMPTPPVLNSIEGGVYVNRNIYEQWGTMLNAGYLKGGLTDPLLYNHTDRTILIQPDKYWKKDVNVDFPTNASKDTLSWSMGVGILNAKIEDGEFVNNRFYNSSFGAILYKDNEFIDYTGKKARLISTDETWTGKNGSIYEIDDFLTPLMNADTTQTIYKMYLRNSDEYNLFALACEMTGVHELLNEIGYFNFTIFAPTDQAFIDAGLDNFNDVEEIERIVKRHIIQRKIFTDGAFNGPINTLGGDLLTINGEWDSFTVQYNNQQPLKPTEDKINKQANNGVLHGVSEIFK